VLSQEVRSAIGAELASATAWAARGPTIAVAVNVSLTSPSCTSSVKMN
jgi:hypothetical protein